jgi:putative colanic acid biosynthesis acetyltransferase WcaF
LSVRNKVARAAWTATWVLLFRLSPTPLFWWRNLLLRLFGAEIGPGVHIYPSARIWAPWNLVMKSGSCLGPQVDCYCVDQIVLGQDAVVSQRAFLCTASHDYRERGFGLISGPITIGEDAWVAAEAYVGPGVVLGARAVAGARAVVVKSIAADAIAVGNPARIVSQKAERRIS